jgi:heptosyltransferase-2
MNRALLVFAPNWLGDAVMALPALGAVRQTWPDMAIDVAARPSVAPLFSLVAGLRRITILAPGMQTAATLRAARYDAALLLTNSFQTARLARAAGIPERWGYAGDLRSWLLTRAVPRPLRRHQVDDYRILVERLGCSGGSLDPTIAVSHELRAEAATLLGAAGWDGSRALVALAPGAAFGSAKRWPARAFAQLTERLLADGVQPVLIGGAADRTAGVEVLAALTTHARPMDLIGRTSIPQLAAVLSHCRTLVTNDSGAMHLAAAIGLDVTAMFGPTRELETLPRGAGRHAVLKHPVWCRPCMLRECPLTHRCMTGISVDAVHAATAVPR